MVSRHKRLKLTRKFLLATIETRNGPNCHNFSRIPIRFTIFNRRKTKKVVFRSLKVSLNQNLKVEDLESAQFSIYIQM